MLNETNRSLLLVTPRKPLIEWARNNPEDSPYEGTDREIEKLLTTAFSVDYDEDTDAEKYPNLAIKEHFKEIFIHVLDSWCVDTATWPSSDFNTFQNWFDVRYIEQIWDLGCMPFESEPYEHEGDIEDDGFH